MEYFSTTNPTNLTKEDLDIELRFVNIRVVRGRIKKDSY